MKACSKCDAIKALAEFYKNSRSPDGRRGDCRQCVLLQRRSRYQAEGEVLKARVIDYQAANPEKVRATRKGSVQKLKDSDPDEYRRRNRQSQLRRYGLTQADYDRMFSEQSGCCAICGSADPGRYWAIDHSHLTGKVRGILCWHCNVALGHFRDDVSALVSAADYLMRADAS